MKRIAVIGAGVSGMSTAHFLNDKYGSPVKVCGLGIDLH